MEGADKARLLQQHLGWTSSQHLRNIITHNHLVNCSVTDDGVKCTYAIYGTAVPIMKGDNIRKHT